MINEANQVIDKGIAGVVLVIKNYATLLHGTTDELCRRLDNNKIKETAQLLADKLNDIDLIIKNLILNVLEASVNAEVTAEESVFEDENEGNLDLAIA
jgi:hypothetical protein